MQSSPPVGATANSGTRLDFQAHLRQQRAREAAQQNQNIQRGYTLPPASATSASAVAPQPCVAFKSGYLPEVVVDLMCARYKKNSKNDGDKWLVRNGETLSFDPQAARDIRVFEANLRGHVTRRSELGSNATTNGSATDERGYYKAFCKLWENMKTIRTSKDNNSQLECNAHVFSSETLAQMFRINQLFAPEQRLDFFQLPNSQQGGAQAVDSFDGGASEPSTVPGTGTGNTVQGLGTGHTVQGFGQGNPAPQHYPNATALDFAQGRPAPGLYPNSVPAAPSTGTGHSAQGLGTENPASGHYLNATAPAFTQGNVGTGLYPTLSALGGAPAQQAVPSLYPGLGAGSESLPMAVTVDPEFVAGASLHPVSLVPAESPQPSQEDSIRIVPHGIDMVQARAQQKTVNLGAFQEISLFEVDEAAMLVGPDENIVPALGQGKFSHTWLQCFRPKDEETHGNLVLVNLSPALHAFLTEHTPRFQRANQESNIHQAGFYTRISQVLRQGVDDTLSQLSTVTSFLYPDSKLFVSRSVVDDVANFALLART